MNTKKDIEGVRKFLRNLQTEIYINDYINDDDIEEMDFNNAFDELVEILEENDAFYTCSEVIYYGEAIEFLKENDSSLYDSLELAQDLGYDIGNINSCTLASLLKRETLMDEFNKLRDEVEEFFLNLALEL